MGMFDKDKEYGLRLDLEFPPARKEVGAWGPEFIVWDVKDPERTISTSVGDAEVVLLRVSSVDTPDQIMDCSTVASAIVTKVKEAEEDDLPAIVKLGYAKSKRNPTNPALIMQFVREYKEAQ